MPMEDMPVEKLEVKTSSSSTNAASRLFEASYNHLNSGIKFVHEHPAESITAGMVLGSAAAAMFALKGRGLGESAVLKSLAKPVQYRTVAEEVAAFSRNLDDGLRRHDALAHVMTLKNPATYGGELRGAISESVAKQMLERPWKKPSFRDALSRYELERDIQYDSYGWEAPPIPRATLKKWFDLSKRRMEENMRRWGRGLPEDSSYSVFQHLEVPRKWS